MYYKLIKKRAHPSPWLRPCEPQTSILRTSRPGMHKSKVGNPKCFTA